MKRLPLALAVLAAALLLPASALAKGPSAASISGPGLSKPLRIGGNGESPGTALGNLTQETGLFPAVFSQVPNPMLPSRPQGKLGPKYTIRWLVPGGDSTTFRITQALYPYAAGGAVTYMKPGQPIFGSTTVGGWYRGGLALKRQIHGLPARAPTSSSGTNLALLAGVGIPGALALVGAAVLVARRRPRSDL